MKTILILFATLAIHTFAHAQNHSGQTDQPQTIVGSLEYNSQNLMVAQVKVVEACTQTEPASYDFYSSQVFCSYSFQFTATDTTGRGLPQNFRWSFGKVLRNDISFARGIDKATACSRAKSVCETARAQANQAILNGQPTSFTNTPAGVSIR